MSVTDSYFAASEHPYWQWQDDGNVIAWTDGPTIVFRPELLTIFRRLQSQSLPPFGAIVLLLAACRDNWNELPNKREVLEQVLASGGRRDRFSLLERVCTKLDRVRALPAALRTSAEAKAELAATVFESETESTLPQAYERLIAALEGGLDENPLQPSRLRPAVDRLLRDLAKLDQGLDRVDAASLALRLRTGLEQPLAEPEEIELPSNHAARRLLSELKDDEELGGVAQLARLLLAAVHLPTPLSLPEELPIGGVSDISNRGSLDRLLLSESANDGLTLAVRVAMNEALYLRRETPPQPPSRRRLVLLDAGIRMWGVPRIFATSVGLALVAGAADGVDVTVYRTAGLDLLEVDMTTVEGLTTHLAALDHRAHPGDSLPALVEEVVESEEAIDVVLVTGDDVYADHEFQRLLGDSQIPELHVATVGRDGAFRLHLQSRRGRKVLRQAQFALDEVLHRSTKPTVPLLAHEKTSLPAIFRAQPFPLLLSCPVDPDRSWHVHDFGALTYARDGRLLHWTDASHGARQLAEDLPAGNLHWASTRIQYGEIHAVIGKLSREGLHLLALSADGSSCDHIRLEIEIVQPKYAFVHQGIVFVGDATTLNACSQATGELIAKQSLAGLRHHHSRFFSRLRTNMRIVEWLAASFNGTEIVFTSFYAESNGRESVLTVFETEDFEGPIGVLSTGMLNNFGNNDLRRITANSLNDFEVAYIARSGKRFRVRDKVTNRCFDVNAVDGGEISGDPEADLFATAKPVTLRHRFTAIGVDVEGRLTLVGRRDTLWPLTYSRQDHTLRLPLQPMPTSLRIRFAFESLESADAKRYSLTEARFADGSRALLDARGLLHLKSSEASLPQLTVVLVEGVTAGWTSDGCRWGPAYFYDDRIGLSFTDYLAPFLERLA